MTNVPYTGYTTMPPVPNPNTQPVPPEQQRPWMGVCTQGGGTAPQGGGYWRNPQTIHRYYWAARNAPPGAQVGGFDVESVRAAYYILDLYNRGKPLQEWQLLPDPQFIQALDTIPMPDYSVMNDRERDYWRYQEQASEAAFRALPQQTQQQIFMERFRQLPTEVQQQYIAGNQSGGGEYTGNMVAGLPEDTFNQLPAMDQWILKSMPYLNIAGGVIGGALQGTSFAPGPGTIIGGIAGGAAATAGTLSPEAAKALSILDAPALALERAAGWIGQLFASLTEPQKYGDVSEVFTPEAWRAGTVMYEAFGAGGTTGGQIQGLMGKWNLPDDQTAVPFAMALARKRLLAGDDPDEVYTELTAMFGVAGIARDLIGHILLDPLNKAGEAITFSGTQIARMAGNDVLAGAGYRATPGFKIAGIELRKPGVRVLEPVDWLKSYGKEIARLPEVDRLRVTSFEKWIAGLNAQGQLKSMQPAGKLDAFAGLTPEARAYENMHYLTDGFSTFLDDNAKLDGMYDAGRAVKLAHLAAGIDADTMMKGLDMDTTPHWFDSAEAQHMGSVMQRAVKYIDDDYDLFRTSRPNHDLLIHMAQVLDAEPEGLLKRLHLADDAELQVIQREYLMKIQQKAADNPKWAELGKKVQGMDMKVIKKIADNFTDANGPAWNDDMFVARTLTHVWDAAAKFGVDWFGIKPQGWFTRLGDVVKRAQSYLLLGYNPAYLLNNSINNLVTMAWDGIGLRGRKVIANDLTRLGLNKATRLHQGVGAADVTGMPVPEAMRVASRATDWIQHLSDALRKGEKFMPATKLSGMMESWSSEQAMHAGIMEYWNHAWREGAGFERMPDDLRSVLDTYKPGLADKVQSAIRSGMSRSEIEQNIFTKIGAKRITEVLNGDEQAYFNKIAPGELERLDKAMEGANTPELVRAAIDDFRNRIYKNIEQQRRRNLETHIHKVMSRVKCEGMQGGLERIDNLATQIQDTFLRSMEYHERLAQQAAANPEQAHKIWINGKAHIRRQWTAQLDYYATSWLAIFRELGGDDVTVARIERNLLDTMDVWSNFYNQRDTMLDNFFSTFADKKGTERTAAWNAIQDTIGNLYMDASKVEAEAWSKIDSDFAELYIRQMGGDGSAALRWRKNIRDAQMLRHNAIAYFKHRGKGVVPDDLKVIIDGIKPGDWKKFNEAVNEPLLRKLTEQSMTDAADLVDPQKIGAAPERPAFDTTLPDVNERRVSSQEERLQWLVTHDQKTRLKNAIALNGSEELGLPGDWPTFKAENPDAVLAAADMRGLHLTNKDYGYDVGDAYIRAVAQAFIEEGVEAYRIGGDEFAAMFKNADEADRVMSLVMKRLENSIVEVDGEWYYGAKAHYGIGETFNAADLAGTRRAEAEGYRGREYKLTKRGSTETGVDTEGVGVSGTETLAQFTPEQRDAIRANERVVDPTPTPEQVEQVVAAGEDLQRVMEQTDTVLVNTETGQVIEPEQLQMSRYQQRTAVRLIARQTDETITADRHMVNIVNKYLPDEAVQNFDQITPDLMQRALEARKIHKAYPTDQAYVQQRANEMENNVQKIQNSTPPPLIGRDGLRSVMLEQLGQERGEIAFSLIDTLFENYARRAGIDADDVWRLQVEYNGKRMTVEEAHLMFGQTTEMDGNIVRGVTRWAENGQAIQTYFEGATPYTYTHEAVHTLTPFLSQSDDVVVRKWLKSTHGIDTVEGWMHEPGNNAKAFEVLADGFNKYLSEGKAPAGASNAVVKVFAQFKQWLVDLYRSITGTGMDVELTPEMRNMFNEWVVDSKRVELDKLQARYDDFVNTWNNNVSTWAQQHAEVADIKVINHKTVTVDGKPLELIGEGAAKKVFALDYDRVLKVSQTRDTWSEGWINSNLPDDIRIHTARVYSAGTNGDFYWNIQERANVLPDSHQWTPEEWQIVQMVSDHLGGYDLRAPYQWGYTNDGRLVLLDISDWKQVAERDRLAKDVQTATLRASGNELAKQFMDNPAINTKATFIRFANGEIDLPTFIETMYKHIELIKQIPGSDFKAEAEELTRIMQTFDETPKPVSPPDVRSVADRPMKLTGKPIEGLDMEPTVKKGGPLFQAEPPDAVRAPLGSAEALSDMPIDEAMNESWMKDAAPMIDKMEQKFTSPAAFAWKAFDEMTLRPEDERALRGYLGKVYSNLTDTKLGALRWGETRRDMALLNYQRRTKVDNLAGAIFPYQFWTTRTLANWGMRALQKPTIITNYLRMRAAMDKYNTDVPTRLKRKVKIPMPFLPDWMGDAVYIDPVRQIFPFAMIGQALERYKDQRNLEQKHTEGIINDMLADGEITEQQAAEALKNKSGGVWDRAYAQTMNEIEQDIRNPMDVMSMFTGFSLPIEWGRQFAMGTPDRIGQLPITRGVQTITGAFGIGGPRGVNLEAPIRKALDMPPMDRFEDYRIDRMLANLAAEGLITPDAAIRGMIDRAGEAFEMAQRRVSVAGAWQYAGAPLSVDIFPEGEREQRELKKLYDIARDKWLAGDDKAIQVFFEEHPEYTARIAMFKEPEERLRAFLRSEIWQAWNDMPSLWKKQTAEQLGSQFTDAFLDKETRSYDSITTETYAQWAQMMGASLPAESPQGAAIPLHLADRETAELVQQYYDTRDQRWPGMFENENYQDTPQYKEYQQWKQEWLAQHPAAIPFITSNQSELYGLPQEIQQYVYAYRTARDRQYPNIFEIQDAYPFEGTIAQKKQYLAQHPELAEYWDWRRFMAAQMPEAAAYILSDETMQRAILGDDYALMQPQMVLSQMDDMLQFSVMAAAYSGESLSSGALTKLKELARQQGYFTMSGAEYYEQIILPALR